MIQLEDDFGVGPGLGFDGAEASTLAGLGVDEDEPEIKIVGAVGDAEVGAGDFDRFVDESVRWLDVGDGWCDRCLPMGELEVEEDRQDKQNGGGETDQGGACAGRHGDFLSELF